MINYDYTLKRSINDSDFNEFTPDKIPTDLPQMVLIEGPNSSGKSTLLNILAMSLYADKSTKLNPELRDKILGLKQSAHQQIVFNVDISDKEGNPILCSEKNYYDSEDILLCEYDQGKKKPLSYTSFNNKYNLIYDIPSNPTERIDDLLTELKDEQLRYGNKIKYINDYVADILDEIGSARDPKKIEDCKKKISECVNKIMDIEKEQPIMVEFLDNLENYTYLRQYLYYLSEFDTLDRRLHKLKEKNKGTQKKRKKVNRKYNNTKSKASKNMDKLSNKKRQITQILKPLFQRGFDNEIELWDDINIYNIKDDHVDPKLNILLDKFGNKVLLMITEIQNDSAYKNGMVYENLVEVLEQYAAVNIKIPKTDLTLTDILNYMKEEQVKYSEIISKNEHLQTVILDLQEMAGIIEDLDELLKELSRMEVDEGEIIDGDYIYDDTLDVEISSVEKDVGSAKKQRNFYEKMCISKNISIDDQFNLKDLLIKYSKISEIETYLSYREEDLLNRINGMKSTLKRMEREITQQNTIKKIHTNELSKLEAVDEHPYENKKDELTAVLTRLRTLSSMFLGKYNEMMNNLIKKDKKKIAKGEITYHTNIFRYLGARIGTFRHIDREYTAIYVDIIDRVIKTKENVMIHLSDMGTGQSQSAYLRGLLNTPNDNRKIIALFDEIAMMDSASLEPVFNKLRELYKEGRLLLCIVVQKADDINVKDLSI
jgi:DNA repair protein SbcC/Rad50